MVFLHSLLAMLSCRCFALFFFIRITGVRDTAFYITEHCYFVKWKSLLRIL